MDAAIRMHIAATAGDLTSLSRALRGRLVRPDDPDFESLRGVHNLAHQATPLAIVRVANAGDVATAIGFARANDLEIAVRGGGHSIPGYGTGHGALVIDLRELRGLHIDPDRRIAWAGAGLTAGELTAAVAEHGLAVPFGDTGSVGIGGITLGGGIGWLVRKHGLTVDSLLSAEVVTADGEVLTASADEHADLFWALRGGGGNFGVVTRFVYRLHPVDQIYAGAVVLPLTREVLAGLVPIATSAPDELSIIVMAMELPPLPFVPAEHHGRMGVLLMATWAGDPDAGAAAMAPFRQLATPLGEMLAPMPYPAIYQLTAGAGQPHAYTLRSTFGERFDDASVDAVLAALTDAPPGSAFQLRVLGGAMARVPSDATAFSQRDASVMLTIMSTLDGPETPAESVAWNRALFAALEPTASGTYVNFLEDEGHARIRSAYPAGAYQRLATVKRRYDPDNVFRLNQNVRPG